MSTFPWRILGTGLFFLLIFFSGFWLSRTGKPYNPVIFTIHKLIALGAVVFLASALYRIHQETPLSSIQILVSLLTAVCLITTIITGGLLNINNALPLFVTKLHHVMPYLTLVFTSFVLYLVLVKSNEMLST